MGKMLILFGNLMDLLLLSWLDLAFYISTMLVVVLIDLIIDSNEVHQLKFSQTYHHAFGAGESDQILNRSLLFTLALEIDSGGQCGIGISDELIVCTSNPPSILNFTWEGMVIRESIVGI